MKRRPLGANLPLLATAAIALLLWGTCARLYPGFGSWRVAVNLLGDNSFIGIIAVGATFVILSGGIDLAVGSLAALCTVVIAILTERLGMGALPAAILAVLLGAAWGFLTGLVIEVFRSPPFIVTLAGMFLARGLAFVLSLESIPIEAPGFHAASLWILPVGDQRIPLTAVVFLAATATAVALAGWTPFGRTVYAVGGNAEGARLMGLPVARTRVLVYTLSGVCTGLGAVVYVVYQLAGNPAAGVGWELDAIAAVVIGGTLLTGGVGSVTGTFIGVLIFGIIQTAVVFQGTLSSWWTRVVIGGFVLLFILLQQGLTRITRTIQQRRDL